MTANVTSIVRARAEARGRAQRSVANTRLQVGLIVVVGVLTVVGLGATLSASSVAGLEQAQDGLYFFKRQAIGVGIGLVVLVATSLIPYMVYRRLAWPIFLVTAALLVAVLVVGTTVYGATRWLPLGPLSFQPSELAKFSVVILLSALLVKKQSLLLDFGHFVVPVAAIVGTVGLLLMLQPDLGTSIIVGAATMAVLAASAAPMRYVAFVGVSAVAATTALALVEPYRRARLTSFLDPFADPLGDGYQLIQSYLALGTGGTFGVGLGASRARWLFLPNAHSDFIFAIIGEETGFLGGVVVLLLFALLTLLGLVVSLRASDRFGRLLAVGLTAWLATQALVNLGGVIGLLPITGIPLPFVSFGSTAIISCMAAAGVLVSIARHGGSRRSAGG
jgi:cell division protein FtsW